MLTGRVDLALIDYVLVRPHVEAGSLRVLAAAGAARILAAPDIPTVAEQGIAGYAVESWYGLVAPARVPKDVLASLVAAMDRIRNAPATRQRIAELGYEPIVDTPGQFAEAIGKEIARYSGVIRRTPETTDGKPGQDAR
jgi:tripartite-type tricarboxylate transporter receptor subunit TctC